MQNHLYLYPNLIAVRRSVCTQKELAERLGISQQEISRYERGEVKAPINYICDVADVCGVSVDHILGRESGSKYGTLQNELEIMDIYMHLNRENRIRLRERALTLFELQKEK